MSNKKEPECPKIDPAKLRFPCEENKEEAAKKAAKKNSSADLAMCPAIANRKLYDLEKEKAESPPKKEKAELPPCKPDPRDVHRIDPCRFSGFTGCAKKEAKDKEVADTAEAGTSMPPCKPDPRDVHRSAACLDYCKKDKKKKEK